MTLVEGLTIFALIAGPIFSVVVTLRHEDRKEKRAAKERLFITLMAHRKSYPISLDWARALNLIDAVYADHPRVIEAWHDLYDYFDITPILSAQLEHRKTKLLSRMAEELGYKNLQQIDIDRFYLPDVHAKESSRNYDLQVELLGVLKKLNSLGENLPKGKIAEFSKPVLPKEENSQE